MMIHTLFEAICFCKWSSDSSSLIPSTNSKPIGKGVDNKEQLSYFIVSWDTQKTQLTRKSFDGIAFGLYYLTKLCPQASFCVLPKEKLEISFGSVLPGILCWTSGYQQIALIFELLKNPLHIGGANGAWAEHWQRPSLAVAQWNGINNLDGSIIICCSSWPNFFGQTVTVITTGINFKCVQALNSRLVTVFS